MTFSYAAAQTTALDRVRAAIGDVDQNAKPHLILQDETIAHYITALGETAAVIKCLRILLARFAREADIGTRGAGLEATRRYERLKQLLAELQAEASVASGAGIGAPYLDVSFGDTYRANTDKLQGPFRVGMFDGDL